MLILYITMWKNLWKTVNFMKIYGNLSRILRSSPLIFWEILRLVLLIKNLIIKMRVNSNLNDFLANKTVSLVLELYV